MEAADICKHRPVNLDLPCFLEKDKVVLGGTLVAICGYPDPSPSWETDRRTFSPPTTILGIVSRPSLEDENLITVGTSIYEGNSGGPVYTTGGKVIGLIKGGHRSRKPRGKFGKTLKALTPMTYAHVISVDAIRESALEKKFRFP